MTLYEINEASSLIQSEAHEDANIIFGTVVDETMSEEIRVTVIATGFEDTSRGGKNLSNVTSLGGYKKENLNIPAFMRKDKSLETMNSVKIGTIDESGETDFEIPAFLRRQAD